MKKTYLIAAIAVVLLLSQTAQAIETCERYGLIDLGGYIIQNNVWGAETAQCVASTGGTGFTVTASEHNQLNVASYPSIFKGCHWSDCSSNSGMPIQISNCSSANFSWNVDSARPYGVYNVAAEAWISPNVDSSQGYGGGAEIMIALDYHWEGYDKFYPSGRNRGTFGAYDVYYRKIGGPSGWEFYTYVPTPPPERQGDDNQYVDSGINSVSGDMLDFIYDAMSKSGRIEDSWYLHDLEAGFEIMYGGVGLTSNSFSFSVTGGQPPQPPTAPSALTATAISSSQIDLTWSDNSNNESGFSIERKTGAGGNYAEVTTVGAGVESYQDTGLAASTTYYYRVLAYNTGGDSAYSNEASDTTPPDGGGGTTMYVESIIVEWVASGGPNQKGQATVVIKDNQGSLVSGATVSGTFSGTLSESASGTTDSAGTAVIKTGSKTRNPGSLTFCVDDVTHASLTYDPAGNVETCDSY